MACDSIEDWLKAGFESAFPGNDFSGVRALPATDAKFGDFQCNDALAAAKTLHMPPRKIAEAVFARLEADRPPFVAKLELAGPGFLNITVSPDWIAARLAALAADPHAGVPQSGAGKRVVIDYSSPNAAKAKEEDGVWKDACRAELVKLQQGDKDNLALWKRFIDISIGEFDRMYAKLGVKFDTYRGESYYNDTMPGVVAKLQEMGLAVESEGALVVNLEAEKLGVAIVRKSDGGYNYTTSDLACVKTRVEEYDPERIIYVTDARQQLHFKQWFSIAAKMGYTTKLVHVPFGLMSYQGKAISTREGNLIKLDELLAEAKRRALAIVQDRATSMGKGAGMPYPPRASEPEGATRRGESPSVPADETLAEQIGYGAVKYSDLSHDPITDIDFSWDKALALEGNSGPYLQYAYARVCSLMEKAEAEGGAGAADFAVATPAEKRLALQLLEFPGAVVRAAEAYKPSVLADYLFQTAQLYSSFYQSSPILKSEPSVRAARLKLCSLFGKVLSTGIMHTRKGIGGSNPSLSASHIPPTNNKATPSSWNLKEAKRKRT